MDINSLLNPYIDLKYKDFQSKICKTKYPILGVKIPLLRKIAKDLLKQYNYQTILENLNDDSFESIMLEGLIIGMAPLSYEDTLSLIQEYLPKIDNWALNDLFCSSLKIVKDHKKEFWHFLKPYFKSSKEYELRFAFVILLNYYLDDAYLDQVFEKCLEIKSDYYYVKMAISWCLAESLSQNFTKTTLFMQQNKAYFDSWTYNKALQKGRESLKISEKEKAILQKMKIK